MKMRTTTVFALFLPLLLHCAALIAQPSIEWQRSYGGSNFDDSQDVEPTSDGGYIVVGHTRSFDGDIFGNHGSEDGWVLKLDALGQIEWKKCYGGSNYDRLQSVKQTPDGGYIVAGYTASNNWDVSGNKGKQDAWILKLAHNGQIQWQKTLGGSEFDSALSVDLTADGGYIIAGNTSSNDGDVSGNQGNTDIWVVKLGPEGELEWQKALGGSGFDFGYAVQQTLDGGYIVAGQTGSNNGDITGHVGSFDCWAVKLSASGEMEWQRAIGSTGPDYARDIIQLSDGGYLMVGVLGKADGHASSHHGGLDIWAVRLDFFGKVLWERALGGTQNEYGHAALQDRDGNFVVAGQTYSNDGDVEGFNGGVDMWAVKLSIEGQILWQKTLGGSKADVAHAMKLTQDGGYILTGWSYSSDGDVTQNKGEYDFWIVKLSAEPTSNTTTPPATAKLEIWPNPARGHARLQLGSGEPWHQIRAIDAQGRLIWEGRASEAAALDLSGWPSGVYQVLAVGASGRVAAGRLVKE